MLRTRGHCSNQKRVAGKVSKPHDDDDDTLCTTTTVSDHDATPLFPNLGQYSDKFVRIDPATKTLTLKHYLLLKSTRHIHIPDIRYITPGLDVHCIGVKLGGLSVTGILWAWDSSRGICGARREQSFVIKVKGDTFRVGFSVEDRKRFIEVLEYLQPGITTKSKADTDKMELPQEGGLVRDG